MSLNQIVFVNLGLILVGMAIAAYFWDKKRHLRWLPIPATLAGGIVYLSFGPVPLTAAFIAKIMSTSLVLGFLFFFVVWIECRESPKKPSDR
jgi:hypothetical protein